MSSDQGDTARSIRELVPVEYEAVRSRGGRARAAAARLQLVVQCSQSNWESQMSELKKPEQGVGTSERA